MNLRLEVVKALAFLCLGVYLGMHFKTNETEQPQVKQASKCVATITKKTNPDGSVDEVTNFLAENSQSIKPPTPKLQKLGLGFSAFTDKSLQVRYEVNEALSIIGKVDKIDKPDSNKALGIEIRF